MSEWDFIVVGAGSSGCVAANRLSGEGGGKTLLLEAGGAANDIRFKIPFTGIAMRMDPKASWCFESEPEPALGGRTLPVPRGRILGGSSAINGAVYNRGSPEDFELWAEQGLPTWNYASVLPYFRRVENHWSDDPVLHGKGGDVTVRKPQVKNPLTEAAFTAARALGYPVTQDASGSNPEGFHVSDFNVDDRGRRVTSAKAFLDPIRGRPTLKIQTRAQVRRVLFEGLRAVGVEYEVDGQVHVAKARREVVLSGGAIGTPHLLLRSGVGPAAHLAEHGVPLVLDLPGVGQNFNDQVASFIEVRTKSPLTFETILRFDRFMLEAAKWLFGLRNALAAMPVVAAANTRTVQGRKTPDMRFMITALTMRHGLWFPGIKKGEGHMLNAMYALTQPRSRGSITLRSADPKDPPRILYNLLSDPWDVEELRRGHRLTRQFLAQPAMAQLIDSVALPPKELITDAEIDGFHRLCTGTTAHPAGSCRMGADPDAVVDEDGRVRGIEGLRVVDLSILPVQISGNPNGTAIMLGDKLSDAILGKPKLAPTLQWRDHV